GVLLIRERELLPRARSDSAISGCRPERDFGRGGGDVPQNARAPRPVSGRVPPCARQARHGGRAIQAAYWEGPAATLGVKNRSSSLGFSGSPTFSSGSPA